MQISPYQVWKPVPPATVDGLQYFEISGQHLEPSTTYMVRVRSVSQVNSRYSDSSEEWEFKTCKCCLVTSFFPVIIVYASSHVMSRTLKKKKRIFIEKDCVKDVGAQGCTT